MSKFIISCVGMSEDDMKELEDELNNPNSDKAYFVINKPCTISEASRSGWEEGEDD